MFSRLTAVTFLTLAACAPKQETQEQMSARMTAESDSAKIAIEAANARWVRHMAAGRADSAAMNFAEDAVFMTPNGPSLRGRSAIKAMLAEMASYGTWHVALTTTRVDAYGPIAVEQGTNVISFTPGPRAPTGMEAMYPDTGKYLTYWKTVNGTWQEAVDIYNSSRALPAPAGRKH